MEIGPEVLAILFGVALAAGTLDAIAGGGGLLTVPALLWAGLPPIETLATNKLQGSFGSGSAAIHFIRHGRVDPWACRTEVACTFAGAVLGAAATHWVDTAFLKGMVPVMLIAVALFFILAPKAGEVAAKARIGAVTFALVIGGGVGFYDGIFGPGTGSFFALAYVLLRGTDLAAATAHTKLPNFTSNIASLLFFLVAGALVWAPGLAMGAGQLIGGRIGAGLVISSGTRLVRPLIVVTSIAITLRLIYIDPDHPLRRLAASVAQLF